MSKAGEAVDAAERAVMDGVAEALVAEMWQRRPSPSYVPVSLTRPTVAGIIAVVELGRGGTISVPKRFPVTVELTVGVGYEPALALSPLLGLAPRALLIHGDEWATEVARASDVGRAVDELVAHARGLAVPFAAAYDSVTSLLRALDADGEDDGDEADDETVEPPGAGRRMSPSRLTFLAAAGELTRVRAVFDGSDGRRVHPRLDRQLRRWLAAGAPPPQPLEDTMAVLAGVDRHSAGRVETTATPARRDALRAATEQVRRQSGGRSVAEIEQTLAESWVAIGQPRPRSQVAMTARSISDRHRIRRHLAGLSLMRDTVRAVASPFRGGPPDWLRPPRTCLPVRAGEDWLAVSLLPAATGFLDRARAESPTRFGPLAGVEAWLTAADDGTYVVHVGEHIVGTVAELPGAVHRATELLGEDPVFSAHLSRFGPAGSLLLEFLLPQPDGGSARPERA